MPSRPGEFHPEPLTDPDLTLSRHPARGREVRKTGECGLLQVWSTTNAKTDRQATAPVPAGILGGECVRTADQCACRLVLCPLTPSARDVAARGNLPSCAALG